jgi:hypothetical protein
VTCKRLSAQPHRVSTASASSSSAVCESRRREVHGRREAATFLPRLPRAAGHAEAVKIIAQGRKKASYSEQAGQEPKPWLTQPGRPRTQGIALDGHCGGWDPRAITPQQFLRARQCSTVSAIECGSASCFFLPKLKSGHNTEVVLLRATLLVLTPDAFCTTLSDYADLR